MIKATQLDRQTQKNIVGSLVTIIRRTTLLLNEVTEENKGELIRELEDNED